MLRKKHAFCHTRPPAPASLPHFLTYSLQFNGLCLIFGIRHKGENRRLDGELPGKGPASRRFRLFPVRDGSAGFHCEAALQRRKNGLTARTRRAARFAACCRRAVSRVKFRAFESIKYSDWRRRRDSNPRYAFGAYNGLANRRLQPLGHVSACGNAYALGICTSNADSIIEQPLDRPMNRKQRRASRHRASPAAAAAARRSGAATVRRSHPVSAATPARRRRAHLSAPARAQARSRPGHTTNSPACCRRRASCAKPPRISRAR